MYWFTVEGVDPGWTHVKLHHWYGAWLWVRLFRYVSTSLADCNNPQNGIMIIELHGHAIIGMQLTFIIKPKFKCNNSLVFWLSFCILQAIENRSRGRPGNEARCFPHCAQTTYRRGISCNDAISSTQEAILKHMYINEGENQTLEFFDLERHSTLLNTQPY